VAIAGQPGAIGDLAGLFGQTPFDVVIFVDSDRLHLGLRDLRPEAPDGRLGQAPTRPTCRAAAITDHLRTGGRAHRPQGRPRPPIKLADTDAAKLRIFADVGGATPSIKYFAYAAPNCRGLRASGSRAD
jgi:hypothetical protein